MLTYPLLFLSLRDGFLVLRSQLLHLFHVLLPGLLLPSFPCFFNFLLHAGQSTFHCLMFIFSKIFFQLKKIRAWIQYGLKSLTATLQPALCYFIKLCLVNRQPSPTELTKKTKETAAIFFVFLLLQIMVTECWHNPL